MALSGDQKKHLLIGGGLGALALAAGYLLIGKRHMLPAGRGDHDEHRHHHGHHEEHDQSERDHENARGEYGRKRHRHHGEHGHGE